MANLDEKIRQIEEEIKNTPYHKATEHHIGKLKARIAKLKEEQLISKKRGSGGGEGFAVRKTGEATAVLVGPPSVGKSSLINQLTNTQSKVADYAFTTTSVIPGMLEYQGAKIQILDIPGLIAGAFLNKGRGKEIISVARSADLVLIMTDIFTTKKIEEIKKDLYQAGFRLNCSPPKIFIKKNRSGGVKIIKSTPLSNLTDETIKSVVSEFKIKNAEIFIKENISLDRLIDFLIGNRCYPPYLLLINKIDLSPHFYYQDKEKIIFLSAQKRISLDLLKKAIWEKLKFIRVYLKPKGKDPDYINPFILKKGDSLLTLLAKLSFCNKSSLKKAKIYGPGAIFPGQIVSLGFKPADETIVAFF